MTVNFDTILNSVITKAPLQKKKLEQRLARCTPGFFREAENFSTLYIHYLEAQHIPIEHAIDAYLKLCGDMLKCQMYFMKTGRYPAQNHSVVKEQTYNNQVEMTSYMFGLALSIFLWETHYDMYTFFHKHLREHRNSINQYLEVGPGHGLFFIKALQLLSPDVIATAVDISAISLSLTRSIVDFCICEPHHLNFVNQDILDYGGKDRFDFITIGEVLEHVMDPHALLGAVKKISSPEANFFVSTCVNAPAIDHLYHFKKVEEIRSLFRECGYEINDESILPVEDMTLEEIDRNKVAINYCAIISNG